MTVLVALVAASFVILKALNVAAAARTVDEAAVTQAALREAKRLLIGYAANTPAHTPGMLGPGRLPCPDLTNDGAAAGTCALGSANATTGRFPYAEIRSEQIVDGTGATLWYALDDAYRYHLNAVSINSDTPNVLTVDADDDIVAVVIAPGAALAGQDRDGSNDVTDFLEGDNATLGDASFTRDDGTIAFNDTVLAITRAELMAAVEHRVLGEVTNALNAYHNLYGGFPWASPFQDPSVSGFGATIGARAGHLAVHVDNPGVDDFFAAPFTLVWNVPVGGTLSAGPGPQEACVRSNECNDDDPDIGTDFAGTTVTFTTGTCTWTNAETFECSGVETVTTTVAGGSTLERTFSVSFEISGFDPTVVAPTAGTRRFRELAIANGRLAAGSTITIAVGDVLNGTPRGVQRTLTLATGDDIAQLDVTQVPFLIGDDRNVVANAASSPASLPRWFTENAWHHHVYFAFAANEGPGGTGCTAGTDCLVVNWDRPGTMSDPTVDKARGVALTAGYDLDTSTPRPVNDLTDYLEGENNNLDDTYWKTIVTANANDQLRILDPDE